MTWAGAVWLTGEGNPVVIAAGPRDVSLPTGAALPFPGGTTPASPPGTFGVTAADLNYDMRSDLVFAGEAGPQDFPAGRSRGRFTDISGAAGMPADIARVALSGAWAADVDTDGDLDMIVGPSERSGVGAAEQRLTAPCSPSRRSRGERAFADSCGRISTERGFPTRS